MKIYTYYEDIKFEGQNELLELWKLSWERAGFQPVVVNRSDAEKNPYYEEFVREMRLICEEITGKPLEPYGLACYLRWLAYSTQPNEKFYVADYDMINNGFQPEEISDQLHFLDGDCPSMASGTPAQFDRLCHAFVEVSRKRREKLRGKFSFCYHDQEFLQSVCSDPEGFPEFSQVYNVKVTRDRKKIGDFYNPNGKNECQAIHFAHASLGGLRDTIQEYVVVPPDSLRIRLVKELMGLRKRNSDNRTDRLKVYTYCDAQDLPSMNEYLDLWKLSWSRAGYEPMILNQAHAQAHPWFKGFLAEIQGIYQELVGKAIDVHGLNSCLRWLAFAAQTSSGKFYVCDSDMINNGFPVIEPEDGVIFYDGDYPCFASGTAKEFEALCQAIVEVSRSRMTQIRNKLAGRAYNDLRFFQINFMERDVNHDPEKMRKKYNLIFFRDRKNFCEMYKHFEKNTSKVINFHRSGIEKLQGQADISLGRKSQELQVEILHKFLNQSG